MSEKVVKGIHYAILAIIAIAFVLPLVWLILASLDTGANATLKLPDSWTLDNFVGVLTDKANLRAFGIGLAIAAIQSLMVVLVSGLAAYPLSRYNLRYKSGFLYGILFMTALPMIAVVVPVYKMFSSMGILDSIPGVILYLTASSLPYGIWLMKNFMDGGRGSLGGWSDNDAVYPENCGSVDVSGNLCSIYLYFFGKLG